MKKSILTCILAIIVLSMYSYAIMSCSIENTETCATDTNKALIFTLSDLADGGSHAIPMLIDGIPVPGKFPNSVCCSGIPGLTATAASSEPSSFQHKVGYFADGHFNRTGSFSVFNKGLYLDASTTLNCDYTEEACEDVGYDTCLFTVSDDSPGYSHVSDCDEYPFDKWHYCCRTGEATCDITGKYWAFSIDVSNPEDPDIIVYGGEEPLGPHAGGIPLYFLVITNEYCGAGTKVDFTIKKDGVLVPGLGKSDIVLGTFDNGDPLSAYISAQLWNTPKDAGITGKYTFEVKVHNEDVEPDIVKTEISPELEVEGTGCRAIDPTPYFEVGEKCEGDPFDADACIDSCSLGGPEPCPDTDCDCVADCIDDINEPVEDSVCSTVDICLRGVTPGTSGCVPAMDCTNLVWSECKNCEAGQPCIDKFSPGTMFMERCNTPETADCMCTWNTPGGVKPDECTNDILDQSGNKFKECIEDEEFPFFDGFNIIAVLLILSMYYAIVIIRKKK